MNTMKNLARIVSLLFVVALFTGCSKEQLIVGKWFLASYTKYTNNVIDDANEYDVNWYKQYDEYAYLFNEDKTGIRNGNPSYNIKYEIENDMLIIKYQSVNITLKFIILELTANTLVLKEYFENNYDDYYVLTYVK